MNLLLDTHAMLWWFANGPRLGTSARSHIADPGNAVFVSVASLWEVVVKCRVGKLKANIREVEQAVVRDGFKRLDITQAHLVTLENLPLHHRDPFDHLLLAQAISDGLAFVSDDAHAPLYGAQIIRCGGV